MSTSPIIKTNPVALLICHRLYEGDLPKRGGIDNLIASYKTKLDFDKIEHSLIDSSRTVITCDSRVQVIRHNSKISIFRWLSEILSAVRLRKKYCICVCGDSVACFSCLLLKLLGRVKLVSFHIVDYSENRFDSKFLSLIYRLSVKYAIYFSDFITVVSRRMKSHLCGEVARFKNGSVYWIPNLPVADNCSFPRKRNPWVVIMAKHVTADYDYIKLIEIFSKVIHCVPDARLFILGTLLDKVYYTILKETIDRYGLSDSVEFPGYLAEGQCSKLLQNALVGLTMYNETATGHFAVFGDSLKIRQYAAAGLYTLSEPIYETAFDGEKYGAVQICKDYSDYESSLIKILSGSREAALSSVQWHRDTVSNSELRRYLSDVDRQLGL